MQLHQPTGRLRKHGKFRKLAAYHGNLIARVEPGTHAAVFVEFVWQVVALRDLETERREKLRASSEQADATHPVPLRFHQQGFDQTSAAAFVLCPGRHGNRANLGQVRTIEMKRATADDPPILLENYEVAHVLADFR